MANLSLPGRRRQFAVVAKDHLRRVAGFQGHAVYVLNFRKSVG